MPFLCGDVTPRSLRVPAAEACRHANGVIGIDHLTVVAVDLDATIMRYRALGILPKYFDYSWPETRTAEFWIGGVPLTVLSPAGPLSPAWEALAPRGQGPFRLDLRSTRQPGDRAHGANLSHGAQIGWCFATDALLFARSGRFSRLFLRRMPIPSSAVSAGRPAQSPVGSYLAGMPHLPADPGISHAPSSGAHHRR